MLFQQITISEQPTTGLTANIAEYFKSVEAVSKSLVLGMGVTGKGVRHSQDHEQYPENRITLQIANRFRAELTLILRRAGTPQVHRLRYTPDELSQRHHQVGDKDGGSSRREEAKRKLDKYLYDTEAARLLHALRNHMSPARPSNSSKRFRAGCFTHATKPRQTAHNNRPEPEGEPMPAPQTGDSSRGTPPASRRRPLRKAGGCQGRESRRGRKSCRS